jgi:DNA-3-methyladenine glycosylase II
MRMKVSMTRYQQAVHHFQQTDPLLHKVALQIEIPDLTISSDHFRSLCSSIISQQLSTKVADVIEARFFQLFPDQKLTVAGVLELTDEAIRAIGASNSKVRYLKNIASAVASGQLTLDAFHQMSNEEIGQQLIQIKGIGPWTVEMFLMFSLGREDIFSAGDLGLRRAIQNIYGLENEPTPAQMAELSQKWSPYRTYASRVLWKSLELGR